MEVSPALESGLRHLFKRCVQCPPTAPQCPDCFPQSCILVPQGCNKCAHMKCVSIPAPPSISDGPNVGAIAGGVAGGIAFIVAIVFCIWFFWIKKRREQQDQELREEWENDVLSYKKRSLRLGSTHDAASTRTRGSLANSLLSRASNFIQIAYIPGVTNRNGSGRNSIHAPVPPIPAAHRQSPNQPKTPLSGDGDALFFGIDDLRGSTYSGTTYVHDPHYSSNRDTRYTMQSITPSLARDSVASDVFWDSATTAPMPASAAARLAPRMVSVKSTSASSTPGSESPAGTPPEHLPDKVKEVPVMIPGQGPSPNSSIRGKATQVILGGGNKTKGRFPIRQPQQPSDAAGTSTAPSLSLNLPSRHAPPISSPLVDTDITSPRASPVSQDDEHARTRDSLLRNMDFATPPAGLQPQESPFFDATELPHAAMSAAASSPRPNPYASMASTVGVGTSGMDRAFSTRRGGSKGKIGGLSAVIEEAARRASASGSVQSQEVENPFGDEHRTDE